MNGRRNVGRVLGHAAVVIVILAVIAAAFAISFDPVRDIARDAGVQSWLVRIYPGVLDAVFLVACACALLLRGARWWNRLYAWFSVLVTGALIGAADVYHATGLRLPRRTMDGTVWALPWALVLLGFSLWLTTLQRGKPVPDADEAPETAADAPVLALAGPTATRAALPAAGRTGGLAEVGFGERAAAARKEAAEAVPSDGAPADMEKGAEDVEPREAAEAPEPAEVMENAPAADATETGEADKVAQTGQADRADQVDQADEPEWPFEAEAPGPADQAAPAPDDATPPYGFPAVSEHDEYDQAPRMPTLLSAPVAADTETAPASAGEAEEADRPGPFERVRSTPTPPQE
jgi:hypothetical protein